MDDLNTDLSQKPSAETPAGGASDAQPEIELELDEVAANGGDQSEGGEDEFEDWEEEGKAYKVPKALKPHLMRNKDYTTKTQEIAETRKQIEAHRAEVEETAKFHRENVVAVAKLVNIDEQLQAFRKLTPADWTQIEQTNPTQAASLQRQFQLLKDQRETVVGELQQKQQQALEKQRSTTAKQYEDSLAQIAKEIPNWSNEHASKLNGYATSKGATLDDLQALVLKPWAVVALNKSYLYDQLVAKQRARASATADTPAPTPVAKVGTRRNPPSSEPLDSDPPDVWLKKRNKQLGISR